MTLLEVVGGLACLYLGLMKFVPWLMRLTKAPLDVTKLGQWAVVTGATNGIGEIVYLTHEKVFSREKYKLISKSQTFWTTMYVRRHLKLLLY